ncbi:MAG: pyridoxal 5'-phosphate synthase glutaminase subunit PdxT [Jiangellales bacterium]
MTPAVGVLALQGDVREHQRILTELGAHAPRVRTPSDLAGVDGLVIPGGESTTIARLAVVLDMMEPLRKAVESGLPVYGSCAGMILLADRLVGAPPGQPTIGGLGITVRRNAFGRQVDSFETDLDVAVLGPPSMRAVFIRAPWVEQVDSEVAVLARVEGGAADATIVAVEQGALLATSFHPELTGDVRMHQHFLTLVQHSRA